MKKVLITGGSGLIGQRLSMKLHEKGYEVAILSRTKSNHTNTATYTWDIDLNIIDKEVINSCDYIVNLAGVNIGEKRWTAKRKQGIIKSRVESTKLIHNNIEKKNIRLKAFISSSAIGYYGAISKEEIFVETDPHANDFLGQTCKAWEGAALKFSDIGIRTVIIRAGIVLSKKGSALAKLISLTKKGIVTGLGSGKQYMPWIHIDDLCNIYIKAIEDTQMSGVYNGVSPDFISNNQFTKKVAQSLNKKLWLPNIPAFFLKLFLGELSIMLLTGSKVSSQKIEAAGYKFIFPTLDSALKNPN